jgi:hypothetical protein
MGVTKATDSIYDERQGLVGDQLTVEKMQTSRLKVAAAILSNPKSIVGQSISCADRQAFGSILLNTAVFDALIGELHGCMQIVNIIMEACFPLGISTLKVSCAIVCFSYHCMHAYYSTVVRL